MKKCPKCGEAYAERLNFCTKCGTDLIAFKEGGQEKEKTIEREKKPSISGMVVKEDELIYSKGMFDARKGVLALIDKKLIFTIKKGLFDKKEEIFIEIPLENIRSADAVKHGAVDALQIRYEDKNGKKETIKFQGRASGIFTTNPQFMGWAQAINELRSKL